MGLIYVNLEGLDGKLDFSLAAKVSKEVFGRMGMNSEEIAAFIVGGYTFGKVYGVRKASECVGVELVVGKLE